MQVVWGASQDVWFQLRLQFPAGLIYLLPVDSALTDSGRMRLTASLAGVVERFGSTEYRRTLPPARGVPPDLDALHRCRRERSKQLLDALGRPALHAKSLGFTHPITGKDLQFDSQVCLHPPPPPPPLPCPAAAAAHHPPIIRPLCVFPAHTRRRVSALGLNGQPVLQRIALLYLPCVSFVGPLLPAASRGQPGQLRHQAAS